MRSSRQPIIRNQAEILSWYRQGYTYKQIAQMHEERYGIRPSLSLINKVRNSAGEPGRHTHNTTLMPWAVEPEHRRTVDARCLRAEARLRAGKEISEYSMRLWKKWRGDLEASGKVVHYDPQEGWSHVPPRPGIDTDLIRVPDDFDTRSGY